MEWQFATAAWSIQLIASDRVQVSLADLFSRRVPLPSRIVVHRDRYSSTDGEQMWPGRTGPTAKYWQTESLCFELLAWWWKQDGCIVAADVTL